MRHQKQKQQNKKQADLTLSMFHQKNQMNKKQPTEEEEIFVNHMKLTFTIYKQLLKLKTKKKLKNLKKGQMT